MFLVKSNSTLASLYAMDPGCLEKHHRRAMRAHRHWLIHAHTLATNWEMKEIRRDFV
jgi:hypothetical protein